MSGVPITSRYTNSVLRPADGAGYSLGDGITREFDLGPRTPFRDGLIETIAWYEKHRREVEDRSGASPARPEKERVR